MIPNITIYRCDGCGLKGPSSQFDDDPYVGVHCPDCGDPVPFYEERLPEYVSIAVYAVSREYGGPEEGGWYYDEGYICEETLRCFPREDFPQVQVYKETLDRRYDSRHFRIRTFSEKIVRHFPAVKPRYS